MSNESFGEFLRGLREQCGFGLREFAEVIGEKPSNLSAVETGARNPWDGLDKLTKVAGALGILPKSSTWDEFFWRAKKEGELPADVKRICKSKVIPALLRTIDEQNLSDKELMDIVEQLTKKRSASVNDPH